MLWQAAGDAMVAFEFGTAKRPPAVRPIVILRLSGSAKALKVVEDLNIPTLLGCADRDAADYGDLQRSWKTEMPAEEKAQIEAIALA